MFFAFKYNEGWLYVRFDPTENVESIVVKETEYYCLS